MARSTELELISIRPSSRKRSEPVPLIERVADGFGDFRSAGELGQSFFEPGFQRFDQRLGFLLSDSPALIGASAADFGFDPVEFGDPPQGLGGDRCRRGFCEIEELRRQCDQQ